MNQNQETQAAGGDPAVEVTLRRKRRRFTAKEKRRIVKEGLRSDCKVAELCRREGISTAQHYTWSRLYDELGLMGLESDLTEAAWRSEVRALQRDNQQLKAALAESVIKLREAKKAC